MPRWVACLDRWVFPSHLRWKTERAKARESGCRSRDSIALSKPGLLRFQRKQRRKTKESMVKRTRKTTRVCVCVCFWKEGHLVATSRNYRTRDEIRSESNNDLAARSDLLGNFRLGKENKLWCFLMFCLQGFNIISHTFRLNCVDWWRHVNEKNCRSVFCCKINFDLFGRRPTLRALNWQWNNKQIN